MRPTGHSVGSGAASARNGPPRSSVKLPVQHANTKKGPPSHGAKRSGCVHEEGDQRARIPPKPPSPPPALRPSAGTSDSAWGPSAPGAARPSSLGDGSRKTQRQGFGRSSPGPDPNSGDTLGPTTHKPTTPVTGAASADDVEGDRAMGSDPQGSPSTGPAATATPLAGHVQAVNSELSPSPTPDGGTQPTTDPAYSGGSPPRVAGADTPSGYVDTPPRAAGPATGAPTLRLPPAPPPGLPTLPELGSTTAPTPPTAPAELPPTLPLPEGTGLDQLSSELFTIFAKDFLLHPFATPYEDQAAAQPSGLGSAPLAVPNSWTHCWRSSIVWAITRRSKTRGACSASRRTMVRLRKPTSSRLAPEQPCCSSIFVFLRRGPLRTFNRPKRPRNNSARPKRHVWQLRTRPCPCGGRLYRRRFRELGLWALQYVSSFGTSVAPLRLFTQLSSVLCSDILPAAAHADTKLARGYTRLLITDPTSLWEQTAGSHVVLWISPHHGALNQALRSLMACRDDPTRRPLSVRFVDTFPVHAGMTSPTTIADYYKSPALSYANKDLLTHVTYSTAPLSMILPYDRFPRQAYVGLAIFTYHFTELRSLPVIKEPFEPEFSVAAEDLLCIDFEAQDQRQLLRILGSFSDVEFGPPTMSPGSTKELPRLSLTVAPPKGFSAVVFGHRLSQGTGLLAFPSIACLGSSQLFHHPGAVLLNLDARHASSFWLLCEQFLWLTATQALVLTSRAPDSWIVVFDEALRVDSKAFPPLLRYTPSVGSGNTIASPSATSGQLSAASRRHRGRGRTTDAVPEDCQLSVSLCAQVGRQDGDVIRQLMHRLSHALEIPIQETEYDRPPRTCEYIHLASQNPSAPAGRALILFASEDECQRAWNRLQGRHIKVGPDTVGIRVYNDDLEIALCPLLSGNGGRGRGRRPQPEA